MTVENTSSKNAVVTGGFAVGATISITFPFEKEDTVMIETEQLGQLVYGSDYEVDENNVVLKKAIATDDKVQVYRKTDLTQERDIPQNAKFNSISLEAALDKLTLQNQEQEEVLNRCLKVETFADVTPEDMTKAVYDVSMNMPDINAAVANIEDIKKVAANETDISTVADDINTVKAVGESIENVDIAARNISDIKKVATNISKVTTVADDMPKVETVATDIQSVRTVSASRTDVVTVANKISNVNTVADNIAAVSTVNTNIDNIKAVGNSISNVNSVAGDLTNIDTVANNVDTIVGAVSSTAASAAAAAASATEAADSASTASTAATNASTSAAEAASSVSSILTYTSNSKIWAEGTDAEVQRLGGEHSSKGWAQTIDASNFANTDLSNLSLTGQAVMKAKQDVANMTQSVSDGNEATTYPSTGAVRNALDTKQNLSYLTQTVDYATASVSDSRYPSVSAVEAALRKRQKISNLTSSVTTGTETYPSNKAVSDALALKQDVANLSQTLDTDTTKYPSNNVVNNAVQTLSTTKQDVANLSQTLDESETKYPSNKAVKTAIDEKDSFPPQTTDDVGKFLQTDGSEVSWETVRQVPPSASGTAGKYLESVGDNTYRWAGLYVNQVPYVEDTDVNNSRNTFLQAYKSGDNLLYGWKTAYTNPPVEDEFEFPDRAIVFARTNMNEHDVWFGAKDDPTENANVGYSWEAMTPAMPIGTIFSMICDKDWVPPYCVKADGSTYSGNAFKWLYGRRDRWTVIINPNTGASGPNSFPGAVKYLPTSSTERYYKYYNSSSGYEFWTQGRPKAGGNVYKIDNPEASSPIITKYYGLSISQVIAHQPDPDGWISEKDRLYYTIKLEKDATFNDPYITSPEVYSYELSLKSGNTKPRDPVTVSKKYISQGILSTCTAEQYAKDLAAHGKCYKFVSDAAPDEVPATVSANFRVPTIPDETVTTDADDTKQNGILRWFIVLGSMVSDDFSKEWNDSIDNKIPSTGDTTNNTEGA